ncbi:uncharacterized protein LOC126905035 [Daktulosphaira vitifoliae]|uniref:uncharacterized protein LOC126905035 n=1 Tax=Daktulosphaira vitifoliae TaxID=58002 RepID=UPI0021A9DD11|nr:uncharacterized protein LOC126905035 [Daktulosphaira vitifoliae]
MILLGLRTTLKEDLKTSPAELVYGQTLRLPGQFFEETEQLPEPSDFIKQLQQQFSKVAPIVYHHTSSSKRTYIPKDLETCTHVYQRIDALKPKLTYTYEGPFQVLKRTPKTFDLLINGTSKTISIDRLKPAYIEDKVPVHNTNTRSTAVSAQPRQTR